MCTRDGGVDESGPPCQHSESSGKRAKVSGKASRAARWHGRASMGLDSEDATSEDTGSSSEEEGEEKEEAGPSGKGVTRHPGNPEGLNGYAFDAKPNGKCRASEGKPGEKDDVPAVQDIENAAQGGDAQNKAVKKEPRDSPGWLTNAALLAAKQVTRGRKPPFPPKRPGPMTASPLVAAAPLAVHIHPPRRGAFPALDSSASRYRVTSG